MSVPTIPEYFCGQNVLITGATGFMGKVLVEKILRCCPDVGTLYVLIRHKRGRSAQERWAQVTDLQVFDLLKKEQPKALEKVVAVEGDTMSKHLGLSEQNRKTLLERVNIIFHVAASVLFLENIAGILAMNVRATYEMAELAKDMKNLKCFLHVSTAYSNCEKDEVIEERVYPSVQDWRHVLRALETTDPYTLGCLTHKILAGHPNVYTLSKSLSEQIAAEYSQYYPVIVMRPSVVVNAFKEPIRGWTDSWNGPTLLTLVSGTGLLKVHYGPKDGYLDYVAVDYAINGFLVAVWQLGIREARAGLEVYSCSFGSKLTTTTEQYRKFGMELAEKYPFDDMVWRPWGVITTDRLYFNVMFFLLQVLPAALVSAVHWIVREEPRLWKITQKMVIANKATEFFLLRTFDFPNDKYMSLQKKLLPEDEERFSIDHEGMTLEEAFLICGLGTKRFVLKERPEGLEQRRRNYRRLYWVDIATKCTLAVLTSYVVLRKMVDFML